MPRDAEEHSSAPAARKPTSLYFVPLGGLEEVGRNMMYFEYRDEIVIIDMGIQFPEEETPGIDYIIPNVSSLVPKRKNIKGVILTHGHYDHIGAIPYLVEQLGNPPIYCADLTKGIIEKRHEEFTNAPRLNVFTLKGNDIVKLGAHFTLKLFAVPHTIPDTMGIVLQTPVGNIVHFADFRIDYDLRGKPQGLEEFKKIGKEGVHLLLLDSTNAHEKGRSLSEKIVEKNLEILIKGAESRIIIAIFASLLTRIDEIISIAERNGRKVALNGRSMISNVDVVRRLGYMKCKPETIIPIEEASKHKLEKILVLTTGAQGEPNAGLMRIVNGEHRHIRLQTNDTVLFSSSVIPGNERSIQVLKDNLARRGVTAITSNEVDIHASGHAPQEDLKIVIELMKPDYLIPIHGHYFMRKVNADLALRTGVADGHVLIPDNGAVVEITETEAHITKETVPAFYIMVDGLGVGDVGEIVLRDRRALAQEGMVVIITTISRRTGRILKNPDIISRGFIYLKENQEILNDMRKRIRGIIGRITPGQEIESDYLKRQIRDTIGQYIFNKTRRRPIILPVVIEI
jgi:ribonuclease J